MYLVMMNKLFYQFLLIMMSDYIPLHEIKPLRRTIRKQRLALSRFQLKKAGYAIVDQVLKIPELRYARHIGIYLDAFGEIPTKRLIQQLISQGKHVYLPLICEMNQKLRWQKISTQQWRNQRFVWHRLGMQQAMHGRGINVDKLDVILMPLVIFDAKGHRVGMGGGFYDRTLAQHPHQPIRIGLAHDFQYSEKQLIAQPWDQKLHAVCTPKKIWYF